MKQCPQCRTTYTDDTLKFCLADGALLESTVEQDTATRSGVRIDIEQPRTAAVPHPIPQQPGKGGGTVIKIVIAVLLLGFFGLVVAGVAGVLYYMNSGGTSKVARTSPTQTATPRPAAATSPTVDPEQERLEKELANVLKKLEDELKSDANRAAAPPLEPNSPPPDDGRPSARVNSPNDGFLALRDQPDAENGNLMAEIPHGAAVALENCEKEKVTVGGRKGRWCMVTYNGETGWVFDAWLQY